MEKTIEETKTILKDLGFGVPKDLYEKGSFGINDIQLIINTVLKQLTP